MYLFDREVPHGQVLVEPAGFAKVGQHLLDLVLRRTGNAACCSDADTLSERGMETSAALVVRRLMFRFFETEL